MSKSKIKLTIAMLGICSITILINIFITNFMIKTKLDTPTVNKYGRQTLSAETGQTEKENLISSYLNTENKWESDKVKKLTSLKKEVLLSNFAYESHVPFLIVMERSNDVFEDSKRLGDLKSALTKVYTKFTAEFERSLGLPPVSSVLPVISFYYKETFDAYCMMKYHRSSFSSSVPSFYEYSTGRIITFINNDEQYSRIYHEVVHQLMDYYSNIFGKSPESSRSFVIHEGMGSYFEVLTQQDTPDSINWTRLIDAKRSIKELEIYQPLDKLMGLTLKEFWEWHNTKTKSGVSISDSIVVSYGLSWSFIHFMIHHKEGIYKSTFIKFLKKELEGTATKSEFERLLKEHHFKSITELEKEFRSYINTIN